MTKIVISLIFLTFSLSVSANIDSTRTAALLYPSMLQEQGLLRQYFEIVNSHKSQDPFFEKRGPSISGYSLDNIRFGIIYNENSDTVDLALFNWDLEIVSDLTRDQDLSKAYGSSVYVYKGIEKKAIGTQGVNLDQLSNFSYLLGEGHAAGDWKPHPNYLDKDHPLRTALKGFNLPLLHPSKSLFLSLANGNTDTMAYMEQYAKDKGGFEYIMLALWIHETQHIHQNNESIAGLSKALVINEDREVITKTVASDVHLKKLLLTYIKIVFSIGTGLSSYETGKEQELLSDLNQVINEIKGNYLEVWKFIWSYEYGEGFAEYVAVQSIITAGYKSSTETISLLKNDSDNVFPYRTGALGGLFMAKRFGRSLFSDQIDHRYSVWEVILQHSNMPVIRNPRTIEQILAAYSGLRLDENHELDLIEQYFKSTEL